MISLFIRKHTAIYCLVVLIVILGVISYVTLPRESTPEIKQPYIFITTTYIGVSASDIETLVTDPIENELEGLDGLVELTSDSRQNLAFIFAEFSSDISVEEALRRTKDAVDLARPELPDGADEPNVREFSVSDWPIFIVSLSHPEGVDLINESAEWVKDELSKINGVLEVEITGNPLKELAIELDPYQMASYGLSIDNVTQAIQQEHISIPGGVLKNEERNTVLAVTGEITDPDEFEQIMISGGQVQVPLGAIARVAYQDAEAETISRLNGTPAITLSIKKRLGSNIIELAAEVQQRLDEIQDDLPLGTAVTITYDESESIKEMLMDLENNMASGFILVLLVTLFFLGFRNSLFVSMAIPLSMLLSFFVLQLMGITLNMIVLFSLILALGMLVDNGIVIVENIYRHQGMGKSRSQSAIDGTAEVAGPIAASTLTTLLAFFPIIFMPGMMGDFMSYLPKTVIVVLSSSLFVALVINPVFCASFLKVSPEQREKMESGGGKFGRLQKKYTRLLKFATKHGLPSVGVISFIAILGFVIYGLVAADVLFFPNLDPRQARINIEAPQGTPLRQTNEILREAEVMIPGIPMSLDSYAATAGQGGGDTASNLGSIDINFLSYADRDIPGSVAIQRMQEVIRDIRGAVVTIEESNDGPPTGNDVSFEVRGEDYIEMGDITGEIMEILLKYEDNFKIIDNDFQSSQPEFGIRIDRQAAAYYGLRTAQIANTIRTAVTGSTIGAFRYEGDEHDIVVRYQMDARNSIQTLRNLVMVTYSGQRVPLSSVAQIEPQSTVSVITHRNTHRAVNAWANFHPDVDNRKEIIDDINSQIDSLKENLPAGYEIGAGAGFDMRSDSTIFLIQAFLVAVFLIFIVLVAQFNSLADPLIIMYAVFLSIGGVMWGFAVSQMNFVVIMSGIGTIALAGVAVNNCIVLVDYTHKLLAEGMPWQEAVVEAGRTRLRPVILTALTTVLALIPMAFGVSFSIHEFRFIVGSESSEYWKAFAWTMLYGLTFATITTLVVVPSMLSVKYRFIEKKKGKKAVS
ncbi:MAG: efflux RND transporter permease subunit [Spirochaetaceae bacterium]|jgi:multidrug efflux pump|nr:efflux RND transporter permease subunit [Spirochaetaceae bacterium]